MPALRGEYSGTVANSPVPRSISRHTKIRKSVFNASTAMEFDSLAHAPISQAHLNPVFLCPEMFWPRPPDSSWPRPTSDRQTGALWRALEFGLDDQRSAVTRDSGSACVTHWPRPPVSTCLASPPRAAVPGQFFGAAPLWKSAPATRHLLCPRFPSFSGKRP